MILTVLGLLDLFISSDASVCSTMAFPPLENSDHVVVSVSIGFPSYLQRYAPFLPMAYDYSCADWNGLCDHWEMFHGAISLNSASAAAASEFSEWIQVGNDVYIPHQKYQVKSHSSP